MRYQCPECHATIDDDMKCFSCEARYSPIRDIPSFTNSSMYFIDSKISRDEFQEVLQLAEETGWTNTLHDFMVETKSEIVLQNAADRTRLNILFMLPLGTRNRALDLGCGWGLHSVGLAQLFNEVYAVDSTLERLRILKLRANELHLTNVKPVHADINKLPFPPSSFDFILSNGVLEWMGLNRTNQDPQRLQELFLKNMYNLLEPGGTLAIGIENRYAYGFLVGGTDNHSHMRFTSIVPRKLATIMSMRKKGVPYQTYTYSFTGYRQILERLGFNVAFMVPFPSYNFPQFICDANDRSIYDTFAKFAGSSKRTRLRPIVKVLRMLGLLKYVMPSYYIVAQKPKHKSDDIGQKATLAQSWLGCIIQQLGMGKPTGFVISSAKNSSPHITGIISFRDGRRSVVKSATSTVFNPLLDEVLSFYESLGGLSDAPEFPNLVAAGSAFGLKYYVQEHLRGSPVKMNPGSYLALCRFLERLSRATIDSNGGSRKYLMDLEERSLHVMPAFMSSALRKVGFFKHIYQLESTLPATIQHGDFFPGNALRTKDGLAILDWDRARTDGLPLVDMASLSLYYFSEGMRGRRLQAADELFFSRSNDLYVERLFGMAEEHKIEPSEVIWLEMMHLVEQLVYNLWVVAVYRRLGLYATSDDKTEEYTAILLRFCKQMMRRNL